jgi:SAM-dependent methyltransferase
MKQILKNILTWNRYPKNSIYSDKCTLPLDQWIWLNTEGAFQNKHLRQFICPFPPKDLMFRVSGLNNDQDFARHGADFFSALSNAAPKKLDEYSQILDFGCGCGRLLRMFCGHQGKIFGCDIDNDHIEWIKKNLDFVSASCSKPTPPLPYPDRYFDAIISISVFTHLNETSQIMFLNELLRISKPETHLFLTIHGETALKRSIEDDKLFNFLNVDKILFDTGISQFNKGEYVFIPQKEHHLTTHEYEYGITFIPSAYLLEEWSTNFEILSIHTGAIHDWQDIVVLKPRENLRKP